MLDNCKISIKISSSAMVLDTFDYDRYALHQASGLELAPSNTVPFNVRFVQDIPKGNIK